MSENTAENSMSEDTPDKTKSDMLLKERSDMLLKEILETLECPVCREYMGNSRNFLTDLRMSPEQILWKVKCQTLRICKVTSPSTGFTIHASL
ncbi:uncharacterized protein LOC111866453 isoform X4 [Cryptotermes secundus]|uniref:uncharacterized protein LOC111866453 isoform X4 n=1 Tax=Cryptotermes secundus TaxID=105785 RepID=UPI000CD7D959|nr:uncharacterized protein LOC111866453 isoform X4 [Cryptotermes secundus]